MTRRPLASSQLNKPLPTIHDPEFSSATYSSARAHARARSASPESPIPTISIDTSLLRDKTDGLDLCYGFYPSSHSHSHSHARDAAAAAATRRPSSYLHPKVHPSSLYHPTSSNANQSRIHTSTSMPAPAPAPLPTHTHIPNDPRAPRRLTTFHAVSLLDFLEAQESEMRAEVQRVLRRMREVKRAVRAVKRERGRMREKDRFADSEAEVSVGTAY